MRNRIGLLIALSLGFGLMAAGCSSEPALSNKVPDAVVKPGADKPAPASGQAVGLTPKGKPGGAPMMPPP